MKLKSKIKIGRGCTRYFSNLFIYDWNLYFKVCRTINRSKLPYIYTYGHVTLFQQLQKLQIFMISVLTHSFPIDPFSTPWKNQKTLRFPGGREKVHWERMGSSPNFFRDHFKQVPTSQPPKNKRDTEKPLKLTSSCINVWNSVLIIIS